MSSIISNTKSNTILQFTKNISQLRFIVMPEITLVILAVK